jgi:hypothetical protein
MEFGMRLYRRDIVRLAAGSLAAGLVGLPTAVQAAGTAALPSNLRFAIRRKGSVIGSHQVSFRSTDAGLIAETVVRMKVKIAFITAFRYSHDAEEHWRGHRLQSLSSSTDDDGEKFRVDGQATAQGIRVSGAEGTAIAPADACTTDSLWNRAIMERQTVIDAQDGTVVGLVVKKSGRGQFKIGGSLLDATFFDIATPNTTGRVWYDDSDRWIGASFEIRGEKLDYALEA